MVRLTICMPILIYNRSSDVGERMEKKKIEKLYKLLEKAIFEDDTDAVESLNLAILQLEKQYLKVIKRCPYCDYIPNCPEQTCEGCKVYEGFLAEADDFYYDLEGFTK